MMRRLIPRQINLLLVLTGSILAFFICLAVLMNWQGRPRFDLSQDKQYTLSTGSLDILSELDKPIKLTLYFSKRASHNTPHLESYVERVRQLVHEMERQAPGKISMQEVHPAPYSDDEDRALAAGLLAVPADGNNQRIFFGMSAQNAAGKRLSIPFFDMDDEPYLEYNLSKLVAMLSRHTKPRVDIISSLPIDAQQSPAQTDWAFLRQLKQAFDVHMLDVTKLDKIDADTDVLLVIHPQHLSDQALYAIDQYILRGGHVAVFVDPDAEMDVRDHAAIMHGSAGRSSSLPKLFSAWGVEFADDKIVLDRKRALSIRVEDQNQPWKHPAVLGLTRAELNQTSLISSHINSINFSSSGYFELGKDTALRFEPLIQSSSDAMVVDKQRVSLSVDPNNLLENFVPSGEHYALATLLEGKFDTAFPDHPGKHHLQHSEAKNQVVLVADTDVLSDRLWIDITPYYGNQVLNAFAGNSDFVTNIVDYFVGNDDLLSIPGHQGYHRPFTRVDAMRKDADEQFRHKEAALELELAKTEQDLAKLQPDPSNIDDRTRKKMDEVIQHKLDLRNDLRAVKRHLDAEIDRLDTRLKLVNIVLIPFLLMLAGLFFGALRYRRGQRHRRHR